VNHTRRLTGMCLEYETKDDTLCAIEPAEGATVTWTASYTDTWTESAAEFQRRMNDAEARR
jgi:hypothetical protein